MFISAEMLIDLLMETGMTAVCAIAEGTVAWVLFRKFWAHPDRAPQSETELVSDERVIAAPPMWRGQGSVQPALGRIKERLGRPAVNGSSTVLSAI